MGQALSLLSTVGYLDSDDDGWLDLDGEPLELRMIVPPWGNVPDVSQFIQDQWRTMGIRVTLVPVPGYNRLVEEINSGDYHLVSFDVFGVDPSILNERFLSNGAANWTGYGNAQLDSLLLEAQQTRDPDMRGRLYGEAQNFIMDQALILPIRDYVNLNAHSASISGLVFEPIGWFPLLQNAVMVNPAS
jgi:peptide/nickel transport system substrate-binding protein